MSVQLFAHNMQAYVAVSEMLDKMSKAAVIHPTGTGKSFISFKWIEKNPDKRFVWLSPSDYIFSVQKESLLRSSPDYPVERIAFLTYARLMWMTDEEMAALAPYGIILDEFHRCGGKHWGNGVGRLLHMFPEAKLLGLSATKIRYLDGQRDMAEELFEGCVASEITLGEAIVRGILPAPTYITTVYQLGEELKRLQSRVDDISCGPLRLDSQNGLNNLREAIEHAEGLPEIFLRYMKERSGKYLVFCSNESHMRKVRGHIQEWFGKVDKELHCYTAYSADPQTSRAFKAFVADNSDHLKLLLCINMLNEGIHVKDISGVILFRPTISPIIYKQQIGRALTTGTMRTPLIFDVVNNFDSLSSYGTIQSEMDEAVERLRREKREREIVVQQFTVIEQVHDCIDLFRRLEIGLESTWDYYFSAACAYRKRFGDLKVPRDYVDEQGLCLGLWIQRQREAWKGNGSRLLSAGQIERLTQIDMVWESKTDIAWKNGLEHAQQYARQFGDLSVPPQYICEDGFKLGNWIRRLRQQKAGTKKSTMLTKKRIAQLEAIGMKWTVQTDNWESGYQEAVKYYETYGHLNVPGDYRSENGFILCAWISAQRQAKNGEYGRKKLTPDRVKKLEKIGMIWETRREQQWSRFYAEAKNYYDQNGNLKVPYKYQTADGLKLGAWVCVQRSKWKTGKKTSADVRQYRLLESIGLFADRETGQNA